jgi:hypothetical protein
MSDFALKIIDGISMDMVEVTKKEDVEFVLEVVNRLKEYDEQYASEECYQRKFILLPTYGSIRATEDGFACHVNYNSCVEFNELAKEQYIMVDEGIVYTS